MTPLAGRRRSRGRGRPRPLLRAAVVAVVVGALIWVLWASPLLAVRTVQVDGVATLPADVVRQSAGIAQGTPLLRVDVAAARTRVDRLPEVARATVTLGWPDRVVITVTERVAVAVVGLPGERSLIDRTGVLFDTITGAPPRGVVPIAVAHPGPHDPATTAALAAVTALPPSLRTTVAQVAATDAGDVTVTLADGTTVVWGTGDASAAKAAALNGILQQIGVGALGRAKTIDVSTPSAVVVR